MRTIIIEDDELILEITKITIEKNKNFKIVGTFNNAYEALEKIEDISPDVIFLDIEMPQISGIEVAKRIQQLNNYIQIVFVTAYEKYALEAFKVNAVDYILKPISEEVINATLNKLIKYRYGIRFFERELRKNRIFTLGDFRVYGNIENDLIKWPTAKVEELFAYFVIVRGNSTDRWKLCELLWPTVSPDKALHSLHNSIYRMKQTLTNNGINNIISYEKGSYTINFNSMECDLWKYEEFIMFNLRLSSENEKEYEKIIKMYKGSLFQNKDYTWSVDLKEDLDKYFLNTGKKLSQYHYLKKNYYKSEEILRRIIKEDSLDEDLADLSMKNDFQFRNKKGIINTFKKLKSSLKQELDMEPRKSTERLYLELINNL